ncbi:MAG TPA: integrase core domain-containing protein, partial [Trueperaceae bacterium]
STVEIINWLDDHSRYLLACRAFTRVGGGDVLSTFTACMHEHGTPASTLTDNAGVYTSRFVGGRNAFEHLLAHLGVRQKNGKANHPTTQGKVERFHQTLKKRLRSLRAADTLEELQAQLDAFTTHYNEHRPHRALKGATPGAVYRSTPKAAPAIGGEATHYRIRRDRVDKLGLLTLRHAGRLHHLGVGIRHKRERVTILVDATTATVVNQETGEILSRHHIDPTKDYWRNQDRSPGRWPTPQK